MEHQVHQQADGLQVVVVEDHIPVVLVGVVMLLTVVVEQWVAQQVVQVMVDLQLEPKIPAAAALVEEEPLIHLLVSVHQV